ncbi:VanZ family protein [Ruminococcus sp. 1001136sp1]|uniref:VanZ family protein n=1 Tax=Ruminococcus sp. 1001136sp1 TaxID=2986996 RepID=UPI003FA6B1EE
MVSAVRIDNAICYRSSNNKYRWILCVVSGFLLSVVIESFQYCLCLGRAETDDVICNTLGCMLGVMANIMGCL